eukprot:365083-Chlamydomonas_euryale.AAC.1
MLVRTLPAHAPTPAQSGERAPPRVQACVHACRPSPHLHGCLHATMHKLNTSLHACVCVRCTHACVEASKLAGVRMQAIGHLERFQQLREVVGRVAPVPRQPAQHRGARPPARRLAQRDRHCAALRQARHKRAPHRGVLVQRAVAQVDRVEPAEVRQHVGEERTQRLALQPARK